MFLLELQNLDSTRTRITTSIISFSSVVRLCQNHLFLNSFLISVLSKKVSGNSHRYPSTNTSHRTSRPTPTTSTSYHPFLHIYFILEMKSYSKEWRFSTGRGESTLSPTHPIQLLFLHTSEILTASWASSQPTPTNLLPSSTLLEMTTMILRRICHLLLVLLLVVG